ncbi:antitoxin Xre/MbcA/ParS toxin-binding domain-containing protein [Sphingomonas sp. SRS2]|uniref:antitoxin Xre/MbcA/ParS toxin-binding domain-containing protein n=1 Tax=Sphingomonas sp. SRS2 TaxID=133190 RepID=UPI000618431E|nr:antitoxin Xre/MbcA/ParS toxin-binding domain-containing protein [Sphingomonas sp. SRS2]KKC24553.1 hypothetical protein WP12_18870 [Sphingomonas sp. SRS2]
MNDWFARRIAATLPAADAMSRRSKAVRGALEKFHCRDRAMKFLNMPDPSHGGMRPIDIAARDEHGLQTVLDQLRADLRPCQ